MLLSVGMLFCWNLILSDRRRQVCSFHSFLQSLSPVQEIFSEKILQQEGDISRIGENLTGTTENLQMANEQIREAIKNNAGFRVWILFFLVVMTLSLLFLDWYND